MKDIFLKLMFNILKSYIKFIMIYYFYPAERKKIEIVAKLVANLHDTTEYVMHVKKGKRITE